MEKQNKMQPTSLPKLLPSAVEIGRKGTQLTANDSLNSQLGSLRILKEHYGEQVVEEMVIYFITDLSDFFNVTRPMNGNQIAMTAAIIMDSYPFFTPEDFSRCFYNIKSMKYGSIYEGLDGAKIIGFMQQYEDEFVKERELINKKKVDGDRENFNEQMQKTGEILLPVLKAVVEKLNQPKQIKDTKPREKTPAEKLMQSWFAEFDSMHRKQKQPITDSIRMVVYKGKSLTQHEFINKKIEEHESI